MSVIEEIAIERNRQKQELGYNKSQDDSYTRNELRRAAACYCMPIKYSEGSLPFGWPWQADYWKPKTDRRNLIRAAALIVAEIERLDRQSDTQP